MTEHAKHAINCPLCDQALTQIASERIYALDGVRVTLPLSYVVERENQIADLHAQLAEVPFKTFDQGEI